MVSPNAVISPPETNAQKDCGMAIKAVVALRSSVKTITEILKEPTIISGRNEFFSPTLPPIMMGNNESTQGANTVSTPARNDGRNSSIF